MKRQDRVALAVAIVSVTAVGLRDWRPAPVDVPAMLAAREEEERGPARLRTELLEKVRAVKAAGGRNLFRYVEATPATPAGGRPTTGDVQPQKRTDSAVSGTGQVEVPPLKYYGYAKRTTDTTRALFYDDERIYLVVEGDVIGGRYRVLRIGATSAEVEDLTRHTRETLAMEPDALTS
jgi:hypothetical protein